MERFSPTRLIGELTRAWSRDGPDRFGTDDGGGRRGDRRNTDALDRFWHHLRADWDADSPDPPSPDPEVPDPPTPDPPTPDPEVPDPLPPDPEVPDPPPVVEDPDPSASLTRHDGTIYADSGDVIENLDIYSDGVGIELEDDDNVTIRNVRIHYNAGDLASAGIVGVGADNLTIQGVELINAGAPASGPNSDGGEFGIGLFQSLAAEITRVTVRDASTGIYLQGSPNATLEAIEGYNMRGPFPRGQLVQFNLSGNSSLNNFSVHNDLDTAWTEDNIHVGEGSDGVTITNGLIDGNNSPSGVGVMLEGAQDTVVRNVDVVHMGNGGFTDLGSNNLFDDVRSFDNFSESQAGRGAPLSGSLIFGLADDTTITNGAYQNPAEPENIVYGGGIQDDAFGGTYEATEIFGQSPMAGWQNTFSWS